MIEVERNTIRNPVEAQPVRDEVIQAIGDRQGLRRVRIGERPDTGQYYLRIDGPESRKPQWP